MSLTIKAATAMHFAGVAYAAGDTIDTTGMNDRSIAVLLKHQPVYVSAASSAPRRWAIWTNDTLTALTSVDPAHNVPAAGWILQGSDGSGEITLVDVAGGAAIEAVTPGRYKAMVVIETPYSATLDAGSTAARHLSVWFLAAGAVDPPSALGLGLFETVDILPGVPGALWQAEAVPTWIASAGPVYKDLYIQTLDLVVGDSVPIDAGIVTLMVWLDAV